MIFNSITFLLFLILVVTIYWALPKRGRLWLIFVSSLVFYGFWRAEFLLVMIVTPLIDYFLAKRIVQTSVRQKKRRLLVLSIILNLALLVYFKYLIFFADSLNSLATLFGWNPVIPKLDIILPIGISFYTFHTMSFIIDTYRGFVKPPKDFLTYGCYVFFFPQLIAGPILRVREVVPQFEVKQVFNLEEFIYGMKRVLVGLFLKVGIADNIAPFVDDGFSQDVAYLSALDVWTLAFMFGFQIYFDFSAYSSIAIGVARLMGIKFPENFEYPYLAASPREFWRRWHISLSSWIRDYLYLPLTRTKVADRGRSTSEGGLPAFGEREKVSSTILPLFLTWAIMGLWHGASWNFVLWGLYHAMLIFMERLFRPVTSKLPGTLGRYAGWILTLPLIMLGWLFFRAPDIETVTGMFIKLIDAGEYGFFGMRENIHLIAFLLMLFVMLAYVFNKIFLKYIRPRPVLNFTVETVAYTLIIVVVFAFLRPVSQFIYFQF